MKEKVLDMKRVNWSVIPIMTLLGVGSVLLYQVCHGTSYREELYHYPSRLIFLMVAVAGMILLHELIHAFCFALYAKHGFRHIKLGFKWNYLAPYCHCGEAVKVWQYGVAVLMPTLLLGFIPLLTGLAVGNFCVYLAGMLLVGGGIGDMLVFSLLRSIPKNAAVIDHPDKVGFYYTVF